MKGLIYPVTLYDVRNGQFPADCNCIVKVNYIHSSGIRFQLFASDWSIAHTFESIIIKLTVVSSVKIVSVEDFND